MNTEARTTPFDHGSALWQFQCQREGTLFYYQHSMKPSHIVGRCPVCGSSRIALTGRRYMPVDETKSIEAAA